MDSLSYLTGFKNHHATEAKKGALPVGQNSPQKVPYGLYAEQLSGSAFTAPRDENLRTWLYRVRPSVIHKPFENVRHDAFQGEPWKEAPTPPDQMRWLPMQEPGKATDFLSGLECMVGNGEVGQAGSAIYHYAFNQSMTRSYFYSADGEMIFVPHQGELLLRTECGVLSVPPTEVAVIPRGIKFQVQANSGSAMGYVCENFGEPFRLPSLGPIGANGLANPRDFLYPVANYENKTQKGELYCKFNGILYRSEISHSPLDVVAWHGNYAPYKYDLKRFNTINTVSFDHPDPSIFTVLTSPSGMPGVANVDFVIFPPRWMVAENTFRPPYYHRNYMNEYMGLIRGVYDAKAEGFLPGGASLHNRMTGHGPDAATFEKASDAKLQPEYYGDTLAFMFESHRIYRPTVHALNTDRRDRNYLECWQGLQVHFRD